MSAVDLTGARVLVTGATGVFGQGITRELVARGALVTATGRNAEALAQLAHPSLTTVVADLRDPATATQVVAAAAERGGLDGVVHALGVVAFGPLEELDDATLTELFETNFFAPLRVTRAAIPLLRASARGGFVANISAVVAENPVAGMTAYSASKAALTSASRALARELRRDRIQVIDVRPPHTETGLAHRAICGQAPVLPTGLDPEVVVQRTIDAIVAGEREVASDQFVQ
ncbi:MAG: SDR family NAD(P)-dependent oxidoreductase [Acidimicrobiia bacterium]